MILLDTDHVSHMQENDDKSGMTLTSRLLATPPWEELCVSIITVEEQTRGRLGHLSRQRTFAGQVRCYLELQNLLSFYRGFDIVAFDDAAAAMAESLRVRYRRLGAMDLKIAAIALVNDATLLTANKRDFEQVEGLRFENWLLP